MRQRILGSHTPPCHRRMVITTLFRQGGGGVGVKGPVPASPPWFGFHEWLLCCLARRWGGGGAGFSGPRPCRQAPRCE